MLVNSLCLTNISKSFDGVCALTGVSVSFSASRIYGLIGENGAGKSTLVKIINGALSQDSGEITIDGKAVRFGSPLEAQKHGVGMVYQELNLLPDLSVTENVYVSQLSNRTFGVMNWKGLRRKTVDLMSLLEINLDTKVKISELKVASQQLVAILRALALNCKVLILDEPTSALPYADVLHLFKVIRRLKQIGCIVIFISHKLNEVLDITDEIVALRNGEKIANLQTTDCEEGTLVELIAGRKLENRFPKVKHTRGDEIVRCNNVSIPGRLSNISFSVYKGEILGFAGLLGAGKSEIAKMLFGIYGKKNLGDGTQLQVFGNGFLPSSPGDAIRAGVGLVPENRAMEGLLVDHSLSANISLPALKKISRFLFVRRREEAGLIKRLTSLLRIKCSSPRQLVKYLSGGNQQKVVIAKWEAADARIVVFDEPTRGIDVGAKVEVYHLMNSLVEKGIGVVVMSSEIDELHGMADRILLLHEGSITEEIAAESVSIQDIQDRLMQRYSHLNGAAGREKA